MTTTRNSERQGESRRRAAVTLLVSVLAHLCVLFALGPEMVPDPEEAPPEPPAEEFVVETFYEEDEEVEEDEPEEPDVSEEPELAAEMVDQELERVEQVVNEEVPDRASAIADDANRVEQEDEPTMEPEASATDEAPPEQAEASAPRTRDPVIRTPTPDPPPALFANDMKAYEQVFSERDEVVRQRAAERADARKPRLMPGYEQLTANVKRSLSSHGTAVRPGNHRGVNSLPGAGSYMGNIHRKIHGRWANGYLMDLDLHEPAGSDMNDPELNAKLEFVISADDGTVEAVNIVRSSGQLRFDAQAVAISHQVGPHPNPPAEIVSPNGKVYVHWNFWRDQRQCGLFGASVFVVDADG